MAFFSIVVVAKNAGPILGRLLQSLQGLSDEVIVCDTGSSDNTMAVARQYGAVVKELPWTGFGPTKQQAALLASRDWVLSLDSDEQLSPELYRTLQAWRPTADNHIYQIRWQNFFGEKPIRHCGWQKDWKKRLFNRRFANWNDHQMHEDIAFTGEAILHRLPGDLNHFSFSQAKDYMAKQVNYAMLMGEQYAAKGKKGSLIKLLLSPAFAFLQVYFFRMGFLDGYHGFLIARGTAIYTFLKYARLYELTRSNGRR